MRLFIFMLYLVFLLLAPLLFTLLMVLYSFAVNLFLKDPNYKISFSSLLREIYSQYLAFLLFPFDILVRWDQNKTSSCKHIILLPGYMETQILFLPIRRMLRKHNFNFTLLRYKPFISSIPTKIKQLETTVNEIIAENPEAEIYLVGHSTGGLVARYFVENNNTPKIKHTLFISTPHNGTNLGYLGFDKGAIQLRPGSKFIKDLRKDYQADTTNIYSSGDNIISPVINAKYFNNNILIKSSPMHNSILSDKEVLEIIPVIVQDYGNIKPS